MLFCLCFHALLSDLEGVHAAVLNGSGVNTRHGVLAVNAANVERPICAIRVVIGGNAVYRLDVKTVGTIFALDQPLVKKCLAYPKM